MNVKRIWDDSFSNKRLRIGLHALFWILFYFFGMAETQVFTAPEKTHWFLNLLGILLCLLIFYPLTYGIIPLLFRKKWLLALGLFACWYITCVLLLTYEVTLIVEWFNKRHLGQRHLEVAGQHLLQDLKTTRKPYEWFRYFLSGLISLFGIVNTPLLIKMFRYLYRANADLLTSEKEKLILGKENVQLELHALKSQVNPHFLFNTLNNIQSFILHNEKERSIELINRLSEIMRFAIYECQEPLIPLEKEIRMMNNYIELEKIRCEDRAEIISHIQGDCKGATIPPFLLITFVENALKHGVNKMTGRSRVNIRLENNADSMEFTIENNYETDSREIRQKGIGLENARKRLQHYYKEKHSLDVRGEGDLFQVQLHIDQ